VRCGVRISDARGYAQLDCAKLPWRVAKPAPREMIGAALGLAPAEIGFENHAPSVWSAGNPFDFVPVANMAALAMAASNRSAWTAFSTGAAFLYTRQTEGHDHSFRARMFAPPHGIEEDPATGSAVAALSAAILEFDAPPDGEHAAVVEQGFEMGRPSLIRLEMTVRRGALAAVRVGGDAVRVAEGRLEI
jgi:trans-2,3-dihydro-3-hydroxyanthranilate isomerase